MSRVFFHVQYLKGLGHLQRARWVAEAATAIGIEVDMVSGGLPIPGFAPRGVRMHQLPPLQAGPAGFGDLRDADGRAVDAAWLATRRDGLLELFHARAPDVLLVESFPFGRRQLSFELRPLLEAARAATPPPAVVCSLRDILQVKPRPERTAETVSLLGAYFDALLVHGDPAFARLEETFPETAAIENLITYTGIVAAPEVEFEPNDDTPRGEVLVSVGAGAIGPQLLRAALAARPQTKAADVPWRLLTGPHLPAADFAALRAGAPAGVAVERFRDDFRSLLAQARLSISYAGYNTSADVLRAGVPAVIVTYSGNGGETEQRMRARRLSDLGLAEVLADTALSGNRLANAADAALGRSRSAKPAFDLQGARASAAFLAGIAARR